MSRSNFPSGDSKANLEEDHQQDVWKRVENIDDPHEQGIDPAAAITGEEADADAKGDADSGGGEADGQADHAAGQALAEKALAELAGAEPEPGWVRLGRKQGGIGVLAVVIKV